LEVANWLAAPVAGAILADMGADVVKVRARTCPWAAESFRRHSGSVFRMENHG
jgi:crotonobetainyl-CoA:carnitine CoA-transferase CaiB-like acyl-CoA transferase